MNLRDYDPDNQQVAVRLPKGGKCRFVPLTDSGNEFFNQLAVGRNGSQSMFVRENGERWKPSQQNRRMHAAREVAEVGVPVTFKSLRTSYSSWQAQRGTPLHFIAVAMGQSDTRMTEKHYAHLVPS